jgi:CheY-like chemotaxis protein
VDDDADLADVVAQVLERAGYEIGIAGNGHQALRRLHADRGWDLVLLDLMMPVMDGWQFRTEQLKRPELAAIPVVAFSGGADVQQARTALAAAGALRKPVERHELLAAIARVFE